MASSSLSASGQHESYTGSTAKFHHNRTAPPACTLALDHPHTARGRPEDRRNHQLASTARRSRAFSNTAG